MSAVARRAKAEACPPPCSKIDDRWWARRFAPLPTLRNPPSLQVLSLVIASAAKQSILPLRGADGLLRYARNDVDRHGLASSRRIAPELWICFSPHKFRGRREGRVLAGTRGLVCNGQTKAHTSIQVSAGASGLPCALVLRLIARSPWRRIPLASIAGELTIPRSPVGPGKSPPA